MNRLLSRYLSCAALTLALLCVALPVRSQQDQTKSKDEAGSQKTEPNDFRIGGKSFVFPPPTSALVEMGPDLRVVMDYMVPDSNRLVAAYVLPAELEEAKTGKKVPFTQYAVIEVMRKAEFLDLGPDDFKQVSASIGGTMDQLLDQEKQKEEESLNRKIKALNEGAGQIKLEKPVNLGVFFSKANALSFGLLMPVKYADKSSTVIAGAIIFRVRDRLVFAYLYSAYNGEESVHWIRSNVEAWADTLLKANQ
jgi:hypothetical protein